MKKVTKLLSAALVFTLSFSTLFNSSNVTTKAESMYSLNNTKYFKDANFRKLLKEQADYNHDNLLSETEIKNFNTLSIFGDLTLDMDAEQIKDLSGIEYLSSLTSVVLFSSSLENIDFSKNKNISSFMIFSSPMLKTVKFSPAATSIEINSCTSLRDVDFTSATNLTKLTIGETNIKNLNLYYNDKLKSLMPTGSPIETISFSPKSQLESLSISDSAIKSIDLTNCKNLKILEISNTEDVILSSYKINEDVIEELSLNYTNISSVNLFNYPKLTKLSITNDKNLSDLITGYKKSLKTLELINTNVRVVDISNFPSLTQLKFISTPIKKVNLPACKKLTNVEVRDTKVGQLTIASNTELASLLRTRTSKLIDTGDYEYYVWSDSNVQKYFAFESTIAIYN